MTLQKRIKNQHYNFSWKVLIGLTILMFLFNVSCNNSVKMLSDGNIQISLENENVKVIKSSDDQVNIDLQEKKMKIKDVEFKDENGDGLIDISKPISYNSNNVNVVATPKKVVVKANNKPVYVQIKLKIPKLIDKEKNIDNIKNSENNTLNYDYTNKTEDKEEKIQVDQENIDAVVALNTDLDEKLDSFIIKKYNLSIKYVDKDEDSEPEQIELVDDQQKSWIKNKKNNSENIVKVDFDKNGKEDITLITQNEALKRLKLNPVEVIKNFGSDVLNLAKKYLETKDVNVLKDAEKIIAEKYPNEHKVIKYFESHPEQIQKILGYDLNELIDLIEKELSNYELDNTNEVSENNQENSHQENNDKININNENQNIAQSDLEMEENAEENEKNDENKTVEILKQVFDETIVKCMNTIKTYYLKIKNKEDVRTLFDESLVNLSSVKKLHDALYAAGNYEKLDVKGLYCSKYNDEFFVCKYDLEFKFRDKENQIIENNVTYATFLSKECKIIQTIQK